MALDAGPFMRLGTRGSPSWPGFVPETGYVDADCSVQTVGNCLQAGRAIRFAALWRSGCQGSPLSGPAHAPPLCAPGHIGPDAVVAASGPSATARNSRT